MKHSVYARTGIVLTATVVLSLLGVETAAAHVTVDPDEAAPGDYAVLTFEVPHGCDGSATTAVGIKIPDGVDDVTPSVNPRWTIDTQHQQQETQEQDTTDAEEHGDETSEPVSVVTYQAKKPLPDQYRDAFELSVKIPDDAAGDTLVFPAVQTCEDGENAWIQRPKQGQSRDDLEYPAPVVTVAEGQDSDAAAAATDRSSTAADTGGQALSYVALGIAILGVALGGAALVLRRRQ